MVKKLLEFGADVEYTSESGDTPLKAAASDPGILAILSGLFSQYSFP
jgi:hypothetical protein